MSDFILSVKNEIGFYFTAIKLILYFFVGAFLLICINKLFSAVNFIFSKFSKEKLINRIYFVMKVLMFISFSTLIGWLIIFFLF